MLFYSRLPWTLCKCYSRSIKERDWTREKNGIASAGSATGRGIVNAGTWTGKTISGGVKGLFTKKPAA